MTYWLLRVTSGEDFNLKILQLMATNNETEELDFSVLGKEVSIGSVDKELRLLWENDEANTNASLINLAVYSEAKGAILKNSEIINYITSEHACRSILIGIDFDEPEASIRAWITAHCNLSGGKKSICCEQLAFQLTGRETGRLQNTVFAHLNSDLPLVFWWQGELSFIFAERLYSLVDRFVFDSAEWVNPLESFEKIQQAANDAEHFLPMDLEWTRSYQIRLAIAGLFDDPLAVCALENLSQVKIVAHPDHKMAAVQLLAWVATRMGWTRVSGPKPGGELEYSFKSVNDEVVSTVLELDTASAPVGVVVISSPDCKVEVTHDVDQPYLRQELYAGSHRISSHMPVDKGTPAELVMDQLSRGGKNTLYRTMLPEFISLLGG